MQNLIKMLDIVLDFEARLESLDSHIFAYFEHPKEAVAHPSQCVIVTYSKRSIHFLLS